jgi:GT2 family glycosyltransferase
MERFERCEIESARTAAERLQAGPLLTVLMSVADAEPSLLRNAIDSLRSQFYKNWELCIGDDASSRPEMLALLAESSAADSRIRVSRLPNRGGVSAASNEAMRLARGAFCVLMDHDDALAPHALCEIADAIVEHPKAPFFYSDEDRIDGRGTRQRWFFKPDWSPDLFMAYNYIGHLTAISTSLLRSAGGFRSEYDGSQNYDLYLRVAEQAREIVHIPEILCHRRADPTPIADAAARRAIEDAFRRRGVSVSVEPGIAPGCWRVRYLIANEPLVSILLPSCNIELLRRCIDGLQKHTDYRNVELVLVDNSRADLLKAFFEEEIRNKYAACYVDQRRKPFNYSALINRAATAAGGEYLLLLNDDVLPIHDNWIEAMLEHAQRPEVGAVGVKLLYPDNTIQHAGVAVGPCGTAAHIFRGLPDADEAYFRFPQVVRNCSAVTAACLMLRKKVFREVGGLDEKKLPTAFQDVDLCLKIAAKGYYNVYTPHAKLYHLETASRDRFPPTAEIVAFVERWGGTIAADPFYNRNLSRRNGQYEIRTDL